MWFPIYQSGPINLIRSRWSIHVNKIELIQLSVINYSWDSGSSLNWAGVGAGLYKYSIFTFPVGGWVGVEIEINTNSAPNWVGVGAGAELGNMSQRNLA